MYKGDPAKANPTDVERYLRGIDFPKSKNELITQVKARGAKDNIIATLSTIEDKQYTNPVDVSRTIG